MNLEKGFEMLVFPTHNQKSRNDEITVNHVGLPYFARCNQAIYREYYELFLGGDAFSWWSPCLNP